MSSLLQLGQTLYETNSAFDHAASVPGDLWLLLYTVNRYTIMVNKRGRNARGHLNIVGVSINGIMPKPSVHALLDYAPNVYVPNMYVKRKYRQHFASMVLYVMRHQRCSLLWRDLPQSLVGKTDVYQCKFANGKYQAHYIDASKPCDTGIFITCSREVQDANKN